MDSFPGGYLTLPYDLNMWISCFPPLHLSHLGAKKTARPPPTQKQRWEIVLSLHGNLRKKKGKPPWQPGFLRKKTHGEALSGPIVEVGLSGSWAGGKSSPPVEGWTNLYSRGALVLKMTPVLRVQWSLGVCNVFIYVCFYFFGVMIFVGIPSCVNMF